MSESTTARTVTFGDKTYTLDLNHAWVAKSLRYRGLPGPNGSTPAACLARFEAQNYSADDIERVIELALIGGGTSERETDAVLDAHVRGKPIALNAGVAMGALVGLFIGNQNG